MQALRKEAASWLIYNFNLLQFYQEEEKRKEKRESPRAGGNDIFAFTCFLLKSNFLLWVVIKYREREGENPLV